MVWGGERVAEMALWDGDGGWNVQRTCFGSQDDHIKEGMRRHEKEFQIGIVLPVH